MARQAAGHPIRGGEYLETSGKISAVAVDKTGTLTEGRPQLTDVVVLSPSMSQDEVLAWAAADEVRVDAPEMIAQLHDAGVTKVVILTGDTQWWLKPLAWPSVRRR